MCWRDYVHNDNLVSRDIGIVDRIGCDILIGSRNNISADVKRYTDFMKVCCELNLEFLPPDNWIRIESDKDLPQPRQWVLVTDGKEICHVFWNGEAWDDDRYFYNRKTFTHWKPLPEPPRE